MLRFVLLDVVAVAFLKVLGQDYVTVLSDSLHTSLQMKMESNVLRCDMIKRNESYVEDIRIRSPLVTDLWAIIKVENNIKQQNSFLANIISQKQYLRHSLDYLSNKNHHHPSPHVNKKSMALIHTSWHIALISAPDILSGLATSGHPIVKDIYVASITQWINWIGDLPMLEIWH